MTLYQTPIHQLHQMRLKGEVSTQEILDSVQARLTATEPALKSFLELTPERAQVKALEADQAIAKGEKVGPLMGMPLAIKDIFNIKGTHTTCGSKYLENYISPYDATATLALDKAGYGLLGKTNMDEFAMGSSTERSAFGATRNPWNLAHVPGGSSGGSASAVAAGQALAALGTDTGGSIRQPASFCGIVGLKPTYGRVSRWGMVAYASSLDQGGPLTKDVTDAALILGQIAGADPKDATSADRPVPDFMAHLETGLKGKRIGVIRELDLNQCNKEVAQCFEANLALLREEGAEIVELSIANIPHAIATYYVIAPCEASSNLGRYDGIRYGLRAENTHNLQEVYEESREQGFGPEVKLRILLGTFALSAGYYDAYYLKAQQVQNRIRAQYQAAFAQVDAIASPVSPTTAFKLGEKMDDPLQMYLSDAFTIPANLAGIPGISVPAGFGANNLPIGLQLLGKHFDEARLLGIARGFERALNLSLPNLAI
ncbi:MAG: aspartyl/glutamyl-tRNA amidotransferase subunit A [Candidatus Lambdaproteobacteria bacterium RIFOXYD2_FULL_50_16]|uniref:Glutamyl-tRNA(Gln) amidotransferase subunit A n=1 Tax=Candidatus Lambdaproteobacteria bacterium RIFOXYD2_FULL_50_16 TaxID=1817772 RepID=A0A1F6GES1_9PROT|nr:MAG: aspartyl/glutamyl-tRNA amidotransferase subunit A [Candidatus Lambdaproteobacteria bacterium RIFOXYD2_FULL_50_16]